MDIASNAMSIAFVEGDVPSGRLLNDQLPDIGVFIRPGSDTEAKDLDLSAVKVVEKTSRLISIQLDFSSPELVSRNKDKDTVILWFNNLS